MSQKETSQMRQSVAFGTDLCKAKVKTKEGVFYMFKLIVKKEKDAKQKGITLIALIVTIVLNASAWS